MALSHDRQRRRGPRHTQGKAVAPPQGQGKNPMRKKVPSGWERRGSGAGCGKSCSDRVPWLPPTHMALVVGSKSSSRRKAGFWGSAFRVVLAPRLAHVCRRWRRPAGVAVLERAARDAAAVIPVHDKGLAEHIERGAASDGGKLPLRVAVGGGYVGEALLRPRVGEAVRGVVTANLAGGLARGARVDVKATRVAERGVVPASAACAWRERRMGWTRARARARRGRGLRAVCRGRGP